MSNPIDFEPPIYKFKRMSDEQKRAAQEEYTQRLNAIPRVLEEDMVAPELQVQTHSLTPFTRKVVNLSDEEKRKAQDEYNKRDANRRY